MTKFYVAAELKPELILDEVKLVLAGRVNRWVEYGVDYVHGEAAPCHQMLYKLFHS